MLDLDETQHHQPHQPQLSSSRRASMMKRMSFRGVSSRRLSTNPDNNSSHHTNNNDETTATSTHSVPTSFESPRRRPSNLLRSMSKRRLSASTTTPSTRGQEEKTVMDPNSGTAAAACSPQRTISLDNTESTDSECTPRSPMRTMVRRLSCKGLSCMSLDGDGDDEDYGVITSSSSPAISSKPSRRASLSMMGTSSLTLQNQQHAFPLVSRTTHVLRPEKQHSLRRMFRSNSMSNIFGGAQKYYNNNKSNCKSSDNDYDESSSSPTYVCGMESTVTSSDEEDELTTLLKDVDEALSSLARQATFVAQEVTSNWDLAKARHVSGNTMGAILSLRKAFKFQITADAVRQTQAQLQVLQSKVESIWQQQGTLQPQQRHQHFVLEVKYVNDDEKAMVDNDDDEVARTFNVTEQRQAMAQLLSKCKRATAPMPSDHELLAQLQKNHESQPQPQSRAKASKKKTKATRTETVSTASIATPTKKEETYSGVDAASIFTNVYGNSKLVR